MNIFRATCSYILIFALAGCIDRIQFDVGNDVERYVIDGFITTDPPPYKVEVTQSLNLDQTYSLTKPSTLRYLLLIDDIGNVDTLREPSRTIGKFYSPQDGMRGVPGRAYK